MELSSVPDLRSYLLRSGGATADIGSCAGDNSLDLAADPAELPCGARPSAAAIDTARELGWVV